MQSPAKQDEWDRPHCLVCHRPGRGRWDHRLPRPGCQPAALQPIEQKRWDTMDLDRPGIPQARQGKVWPGYTVYHAFKVMLKWTKKKRDPDLLGTDLFNQNIGQSRQSRESIPSRQYILWNTGRKFLWFIISYVQLKTISNKQPRPGNTFIYDYLWNHNSKICRWSSIGKVVWRMIVPRIAATVARLFQSIPAKVAGKLKKVRPPIKHCVKITFHSLFIRAKHKNIY
jgi:hypothetical protein